MRICLRDLPYLLPSPLVGEGGLRESEGRKRGPFNARRPQPLSRRAARGTLSHKGRGLEFKENKNG